MRYVALSLLMLVAACTPDTPDGLSYDPPGSTNTTDKPITPQEKQTLRFGEVWFSNAFEGARLTNVTQDAPDAFTALIQPENAPINNSPWYAFQVGAETPQQIRLTLTYDDGDHRYIPKLSSDGRTWTPIAPDAFMPDTTAGTATLVLDVTPEPLWVAGQELITSSVLHDWAGGLAQHPYVTLDSLGASKQGRPITTMTITENPASTDYVLILCRQHPPEVTGQLGCLTFLETVAADTPLAQQFRQQYQLLAVPLMNPDGVDNGHWRHNAGGVDLNRDWSAFNQPETKQVADFFLQLNENPRNHVHFTLDFHSTQEDVFYTLARHLETDPPGFTDAWLDKIREALPDYYVNDESYDLGPPISKNWFYETFKAPSITYEVGDETDRDLLHDISEAGAIGMMELLVR